MNQVMNRQIDPYRVLQVVPTAEQEVINAAYRALALKYHPDRDASTYARRRMLELNAAYALLRDERAREGWEREQRTVRHQETGVRIQAPPRSEAAGTRVPFGRYQGWTLRDLARQDPEYLRWLSRHSSGIAYRTEIYQILGRAGASAA
jgi:curved DNA-binding protein CbpA